MEVLFVCTGNTCRSPMAEFLLRDKILKAGLNTAVTISSAGLAAVPGAVASANAIAVLKDKGINANNHKARLLNLELLKQADLVLTMTKYHKNDIIKAVPTFSHKVLTLGEFAEAAVDVGDPFGGDETIYKNSCQQIATLLELAWPKILAMKS